MSKQDPRVRQIIKYGDANLIIELSNELGRSLADADLGKTQIRNLFGMVKQLQSAGYDDDTARTLQLMVPKLVYAKARESKLEPLTDVLVQAIGEVENRTHFVRFAELFEAIVAYHYAASKAR